MTEGKLCILDLGTGSKWRNYNNNNDTIHCVDSSYLDSSRRIRNITLYSYNIVDFLEEHLSTYQYNLIRAVRVFEHFPYKEIPYILYLCKEILAPNGEIQIIVPNYEKILTAIKQLDIGDNATKFNRTMIDIHTELFNEPNDPHQSVWTTTLAQYYLTLEDFWTDIKYKEIKLDNRDWYLDIIARKK